jgi:hypothetical protein
MRFGRPVNFHPNSYHQWSDTKHSWHILSNVYVSIRSTVRVHGILLLPHDLCKPPYYSPRSSIRSVTLELFRSKLTSLQPTSHIVKTPYPWKESGVSHIRGKYLEMTRGSEIPVTPSLDASKDLLIPERSNRYPIYQLRGFNNAISRPFF